jgi:RimJ/RimL family protein N-acetyltransferase
MKRTLSLNTMNFDTQRLQLHHVTQSSAPEMEADDFLANIVNLLTPAVVLSLPPNFHQVDNPSKAATWLTGMLAESHLYSITLSASGDLIGFLFLSKSDVQEAHLGYLLGETYWGQGYGSEILKGLLTALVDHTELKKLTAGVDRTNIASARLLEKVGFVEAPGLPDQPVGVVFYEYLF